MKFLPGVPRAHVYRRRRVVRKPDRLLARNSRATVEHHKTRRATKCVPLARASSPVLEMNVCPLTGGLR